MKASEDKSWERFIDKAMQEANPEEPGIDFTEKVLAALETKREASAVTRYKAPISRLTWVVIGIVFSGVVVWASITGTSTQWDWASRMSSFINFTNPLERMALPDLEYSSIYSIGFFAFFVLLQILFMKRIFDRRLGLE